MMGRVRQLIQVFMRDPIFFVGDPAPVPVADPFYAGEWLPCNKVTYKLPEGHLSFAADTNINLTVSSQYLIGSDCCMDTTHDGQNIPVKLLGGATHLKGGGNAMGHGRYAQYLRPQSLDHF